MKNKDGSYYFVNWESLEKFMKFYNDISNLLDFANECPDFWYSFKEHHKDKLDKLIKKLEEIKEV